MGHKKRAHSHREERIPINYVEYDLPVREAGHIERVKHRVTRHVKQAHRLQHVAGVIGNGVRRRHARSSGRGVMGVHPSNSYRNINPHSNMWANGGRFPNVGNVNTVVGSRFIS